jgi:hypothetical protein
MIAAWYILYGRGARIARVSVLAGVLLVALAAGGIVATRSSAIGPIERFKIDFAPNWSAAWLKDMAVKLEDRGGYGTVAMSLIREFPCCGVGVGAFHIVWWNYGWPSYHIQPDNAQNWFRHQVAEFGVMGSVGWVIWVAWLLWLLLFARNRRERPLTAMVLRGVLIGFGLVSLVGMPAQEFAVALSFWTLAFWFVTLLEPRHWRALDRPAFGTASWVAASLVVLAFCAATAYVGWTTLRPPVRAAATGTDYGYGFYAPPEGQTFRWAAKEAVTVLPAAPDRRWLRVKVWVERLNIARGPVDVKVWTDRQRIVDTRLSSIQPITRYFRVPDGRSHVLLETWVNRTFRPRQLGLNDDRELGLVVDWAFVAAPPPDVDAGN